MGWIKIGGDVDERYSEGIVETGGTKTLAEEEGVPDVD